ncbi:unnamed protein product [Spirodela intermedia]|uniref:DUF7895 domain-containing protein n=1 Tax=Spirodela intermedia TaxID=51605 RepID=A0A7I8J8Z2_SPIIN|nr:unnamed protein product [Spirodela intermedia]CAA6666554.1 unnamed protein product [Spirodela intermedia]
MGMAFPDKNIWSLDNPRPRRGRRERCLVLSALPETAVSVIVTAVAVGAAATFLRRIPEASPNKDSSFATCEDCGGSGICSECKGEGFVLKKLTDENAEKARLTAKNMATRYTAGLPRKWTYCNKCSASRSCTACKGSGKTNAAMNPSSSSVEVLSGMKDSRERTVGSSR